MHTSLLLASLFAFVGCSRAPNATATSTPNGSAAEKAESTPPRNERVTVGKHPPDFTAKDQDGKDLHLAALKGKPVVVYFYPKDETPGCTKEACAFRDAWTSLSQKGVVLVGISGDTDESHRAFIKNHDLPFTLVSDPDGKIAELFDVPFHLGFAGRQTFVIGADGNVKKIYRTVDVATHAKEVSDDLK